MTSCSLGSLCWSYSGVLLVPVCCRVIAVCCRVIAFCSGEEVQILDFQNFNIDYPHHLTAEQQSSWFQMPVDNSCVTTAHRPTSSDRPLAARPRCAVLPSLASLTLVPTPVLEPSTEAAWCADGHDGSWLDDADQGTGEFPQQKDNPKRTVARELRDDERPNMESILRVCERLSNITTPLMSRKPKRIFPEKALMAAGGGPLLCFDSLLAGIGMLTVGVWSIRGWAGV